MAIHQLANQNHAHLGDGKKKFRFLSSGKLEMSIYENHDYKIKDNRMSPLPDTNFSIYSAQLSDEYNMTETHVNCCLTGWSSTGSPFADSVPFAGWFSSEPGSSTHTGGERGDFEKDRFTHFYCNSLKFSNSDLGYKIGELQ